MPDVSHLTYVGIFAMIALSGHIVPVPEDAAILVAGYAAGVGLVSLPLVLLVAALATFSADSAFYIMARKGGAFAKLFESHVKSAAFQRAVARLHDHPRTSVFFARFVPGMRFAMPLIAGGTKLPSHDFFPAAGLASCTFTPIAVLVGYAFHAHLGVLLRDLEEFKHVAFALIVLTVAISASVFAVRRFLSVSRIEGPRL